MAAIVIAFTIGFCVYLFMGFSVLLLNPGNKINRSFFLLAIFFSLLCASGVIIQLDADLSRIDLVFRSATCLSLAMLVLMILLSAFISGLPALHMLAYVSIVPVLYLSYKTISLQPLVTFTRLGDSWRVLRIDEPGHLWATMLFYSLSILACVACLLVWRRRTPLRRERKQALVLSSTFLLCGVANVAYMLLEFNALRPVEHPFPGDATLFYLVWMGGIAFCIVRYRFLAITPEYVGSEILSGIDESVILLDRHKTVLAVNRKTYALAGNEELMGRELSSVVSEHGIIAGEIESLLAGTSSDFACRLHLMAAGGARIYMDARISSVSDRFGDVLGVLIICKEVRELSQIRLLYRITPREMEIIQRIIDGRTNIEIAAGLSISENTLKRHISNIYNKTGVNNKIELFRLMKEFNLMPLYPAKRTLLVANR